MGALVLFRNIKFLRSIKEKARSRKLFKNVTYFRSKQIPLMLVCEGEETFLNEFSVIAIGFPYSSGIA